MFRKDPLASFKYAWTGIRIAWSGLYFRVGVFCALGILAAAFLFDISRLEFVAVIILIGAVLAAEAFNTAIEELCDAFCPHHDPRVARIKDLASGAVLVIACAATTAGVVIFLPHLMSYT